MTDAFLEHAVLGAALLYGKALPPEAFLVEPEFFATPRNASIWSAIMELTAERSEVDEITVTKRLKEWGETTSFVDLAKLTDDCATSVNLDHYCRLLTTDGRKKRMSHRLKQLADSPGIDATSLATFTAEALKENQTVEKSGLSHISDSLKIVLREIMAEAAGDRKSRVIKTELRDLDDELQLIPAALTVIAGRPGMGKSALAANISSNVAKQSDGAVALFSLEMSTSEMIRRVVAAETGVSVRSMAHKLDNKDFHDAWQRLSKIKLWIDDRSGLNVQDIRSSMLRLPKVDLCVVDYLQLTKMGKAERHDLRVGEVTKGLKALSKEFDCHVIALSQLNRGVEQRDDKRPRLSDLRDSGNIEEDADNVLFVYRPSYYGLDDDFTRAEIIIDKHRHGRTGSVFLTWDGACQRFTTRK